MVKITVHYCASIKEAIGCSHETIETQQSTVGQLFEEIKSRYNLNFDKTLIKAAINNEFCNPETELSSHDEIIFMPPISGG